jgi:HSP20 family protein
MRLISFNRPDPSVCSPASRPAEEDFNRVLNTFWGELSLPAAGYVPRLDVRETADHVIVQVDLPGVARQHLSLSLEKGILTLQGQRPAEHKAENAGEFTRVERSWGHFERQVRLGEAYSNAPVKAELKDGVLTVSIPKAEAAKPRAIEIL